MELLNLNTKTLPSQIDKEFLKAYDLIPDPVIIHKRKEIIYCNDSCVEFLELNNKCDAIKRGIKSFIHPDSIDAFERLNYELMFNKIEPLIELKVVTANGNEKNIEVHRSPITLNGKFFSIAILRDITSRIYLDDYIKKSEEKYRYILEYLPLSVIKFNDEIITYANHAAAKLFGFNSSFELLNTSLSTFYHPDYEYEYIKRRQALINGQKVNPPKELKMIRIDGKVIDIETVSSMTERESGRDFIVVIIDVTERNKLKEDLKKIESRINAITENSSDSILIHRDYKIEYVNNNMLRLLGYKNKNELVGENIEKIVPKDFEETVKERLRVQYEEGESFKNIRSKMMSSQGDTINLVVSTVGFNLNDKPATIVVANKVNKEEVLKLSYELDKKEAELNRLNNFNKSKSEFFAVMSHELKTPLNVNLSTLQLLELYMNSNLWESKTDSIKNHLYTLKKNCYRQLKVINNSIDISKVSLNGFNARFKYYDIVEILENIVDSINDTIDYKNIRLKLNTILNSKIVKIDSQVIEKVILNLISNAYKVSSDNDIVLLTLSDIDGRAIISVEDRGPGISEEFIDGLFEPFNQIGQLFTRTHEGTGLGLPLVKALIEIHGGKLDIKTNIGKGSIFSIILPKENISIKALKVDYYEIEKQTIQVNFSDLFL